MAKVKSDKGALPVKTRVVAVRPLLGVPEGTAGRIETVNGLTWIRYWVHFDNGVWLGPVDARAVVEASDWRAYQQRREAEAAEAARRATEAPEPEAAAPEAEAAPAASDGAASKIPAALLARSQAARAKAEKATASE
ncbi:MAG: hypothetical protein WD232_06990 [Acidimicrobiales bacterium]